MLKCLPFSFRSTALGVGLIYLRLLQGPISVGFIVAPVERGLNAELPEFSVKIEDAIVQLSERKCSSSGCAISALPTRTETSWPWRRWPVSASAIGRCWEAASRPRELS